jgi:hypothetical protein
MSNETEISAVGVKFKVCAQCGVLAFKAKEEYVHYYCSFLSLLVPKFLK